MSIHCKNDENNQRKCIEFITKTLLNSKAEENEKSNFLIIKVVDITKVNTNFKINVLELCLSSLEKVNFRLNKNENVILTLKILMKLLKDNQFEKDNVLSDILFERNNLIKGFVDNFAIYQKSVKERAKGISLLELKNMSFDGFTHYQNIKTRIDFMNHLIKEKLWSNENYLVKPIDFIFHILFENGVNDEDKSEFFKWLNSNIDKLELNSEENDESLFKIFTEKISSSAGFTNLTLNAFHCFLKVFFEVNSKENKLQYKKLFQVRLA